ncbi:hypothetical protein ES708_31543 [subsurface metagenome]
MAERKCLCGSRAYYVGQNLILILDEMEGGKVPPAADIEQLGAGIRGLYYCGIDTTKIERQFDVLKESFQKMAKAETSLERHRARMDALLDHSNLEKEIGDTLEKCSK